jgi:hypothetical protein
MDDGYSVSEENLFVNTFFIDKYSDMVYDDVESVGGEARLAVLGTLKAHFTR